MFTNNHVVFVFFNSFFYLHVYANMITQCNSKHRIQYIYWTVGKMSTVYPSRPRNDDVTVRNLKRTSIVTNDNRSPSQANTVRLLWLQTNGCK